MLEGLWLTQEFNGEAMSGWRRVRIEIRQGSWTEVEVLDEAAFIKMLETLC
jgi:hypothetical protein